MEEDNKILNYRGLSHLIEKLKAFFIKNPKQRDAGKYLRCIDSDGNVEWASLPSFVNLIDGFDPTSLIIGGISGRTLTTEAEVRGDCYIATAAGTLFPGTVSAITLEAGDSIIFRKDVAAGTSITANDIIFIESSVSISPGASLLSWDTEITLATVEGVAIKAKLPINPNTDTQANWNETDTNSAAYILNKPSIPSAQVLADWNAVSGVSLILNKPSLAAVATSGDYLDLINVPISVDQYVVRSKFELPIRAKLTELSIIDDPTIAPSGYTVPCVGIDTISLNNQYILWDDDSTYQAFNMYIYWDTVNLILGESYLKCILIENSSNSTLTINLPSNSTTYDTVYNMYGSTTMTIPSGKIGELIFTFNCVGNSLNYHTNVSFNGGVSL